MNLIRHPILPSSNLRNIFFLSAFTSLLLFPMLCAGQDAAQTLSANNLSIENLSVAPELGKIKERFKGTKDRTVIQIQDVHAHFVAQENIATILEHLRTAFQVDRVALEGAWSTTSLPKSQALPSSREKQLLARTLMEDDLISGPIYAAILSPEPITLAGIEEEPLYEKNRQIYLKHLERLSSIQEKLAASFEQLKTEQSSIWNPDLLALGKLFAMFQEKGDPASFLFGAVKTAQAHQVDLADLSQIDLLLKIADLERSVDRKRFQAEIGRLMENFKNTPYTLEELIRGGRIPEEKLGLYPEIKKLQRLIALQDKVSIEQLQSELGVLTQRIVGALAVTDEETAVWEKTGRFYTGQNLLLLQATPGILKTAEKELPRLREEFASAGLQEEFALALDFYATVKERDDIFMERILKDPALAGTIAIVTGGFHTDGLSQKLRSAGISYITISPELGDGRINESLYEKRMADSGWQTAKTEKPVSPTSSPIHNKTASQDLPSESQTLSELQDAPERIESRFPQGLDILKKTRNLPAAMRSFDPGNSVAAPPLRRETRSSKKAGLSFPYSAEKFSTASHEFQLAKMQGLMDQVADIKQRAMVVSTSSVLKNFFEDPKTQVATEDWLANTKKNGDIIALAQDLAKPTDLPVDLLISPNVERFDIRNEDPSLSDLDVLIMGTSRFKTLVKKYKIRFVVIKNGYLNPRVVVLPESVASFTLYRIIGLCPDLYRLAKDPAFAKLLEELVAEILSRETVQQAA